MSVIQVILSGDFIIAGLIYTAAILIFIPLFARVSELLEHPFLTWQWDHIGMPLLQACLIVLFIIISYPVIYGVREAPGIIDLISQKELRLNNLINLIFILTLLFPLLPVIGEWRELIFPMQGIAACMMIFSWLAVYQDLESYSFWPGPEILIYCIVLALITHELAMKLAEVIGHKYDQAFNVTDSGELFAQCLILFMQSPVILLFSLGLGKQLFK